MVENFLEDYIKKIVRHPQLVSIEKNTSQDGYEFIIYVANEDIGKVIGRDGKMITSIKAFINGCKAKDGLTYKVMAKSADR